MNVQINGQPTAVTDGVVVLDYLKQRDLNADHVVVELNREVVERSRFADIELQDGDELEILRFVGGG